MPLSSNAGALTATWTPERVRNLRHELDLNQPDFARLVGVHPYTISDWEAGVNTPTPLAQRSLEALLKKHRWINLYGDCCLENRTERCKVPRPPIIR